MSNDSSAILIGTKFYAAFDSSMTITEINSLCSLYSVTLSNQVDGLHNVYYIYNNPVLGISTLDLANQFYSLIETRYSQPEFGVKPILFSYNLFDFYHDFQPHTKKVIGEFNVASVWDFAGLTDSICH